MKAITRTLKLLILVSATAAAPALANPTLGTAVLDGAPSAPQASDASEDAGAVLFDEGDGGMDADALAVLTKPGGPCPEPDEDCETDCGSCRADLDHAHCSNADMQVLCTNSCTKKCRRQTSQFIVCTCSVEFRSVKSHGLKVKPASTAAAAIAVANFVGWVV